MDDYDEIILKTLILALLMSVIIFMVKVYIWRSNPCFENAIDRNLTLKQYYFTVDADAYKLKYNDWNTYTGISRCNK